MLILSVNSFLRWRIALMELGIKAMDLPNATVPIPDYNPTAPHNAIDTYQMIQLHDYQNVSFFRMDSATKAASKKTIEVMASYYPELLSQKFFVNIPFVMSWVFTAMKTILSKETLRKFRVLSSGKGVANDLGEDVPKVYGGNAADLTEVGITPKLIKDTPTEEKKKEKKPSKKPSMDKVKEKGREKEKEKVLDSVAEAAKESSTAATAPTVATIPEAKEEEAAPEKVDAAPEPPAKDDAPAIPSEAPIPPAKDDAPVAAAAAPEEAAPAPPAKDEPVSLAPAKEESKPAESAISQNHLEEDKGSVAIENTSSSGVGSEESGVGVAIPTTSAVEETKPDQEKSEKDESAQAGEVRVDDPINEEKKAEETNAGAVEAKAAA